MIFDAFGPAAPDQAAVSTTAFSWLQERLCEGWVSPNSARKIMAEMESGSRLGRQYKAFFDVGYVPLEYRDDPDWPARP